MEGVIRFFVNRPLLVHAVTFAVVALGIRSATTTPRETFPDITLNQLVVQAVLPGASALDVETKLTIPVEEAIDRVDGVKEHFTIITDSLSMTIVEFDTDITRDELDEAELDLRTQIEAINDFPAEMEDDPVILRFAARKFPIVEVALAGPSLEVVETARLLERKLERLDEVSRVSAEGLRDSELRILVAPSRARELGVTLLDVVRAIERHNVSSTGGSFESNADRRQVVLWSRYSEPEEVADTIVRFSPGSGAIRIRDIGRVELGREDTRLRTHTNGRPGVSLVISKQANADVIEASEQVRALIDETPLPEGVSATVVRDESYWTKNRLELIVANGIVGATLIAVTLYLFLSPMVAVWVLVGIPVVFLGVLLLFPVFDLSVNVITLTGLVVVLGMVVDDAVVVAERIVAHRQSGRSSVDAATAGAVEMARPVLASALTTMLAFMPLWAIGGMAGKMIRSMPWVVCLALAISLLESFLVLPGHMASSDSSVPPPKRAFVVRLERAYRRLLEWALARRAWVLGAFVAVLCFVFVVIAPRLAVTLFPQDDAEAIFVKVSMPLGTPIERTEAVVTSIETQMAELMGADLSAVTARIGHQETSEMSRRDRGAAENEAVVKAIFRREKRALTPLQWMGRLEEDLVVPADAHLLYESAQVGPPVGLPVTVHVAGNADGQRRGTAIEVANWLRSIDGVVNVDIDERPGTPQVDLNLDYEKLALLGLSPQDVALTLQAAFHGVIASEHRDLDETTDFRVLLDPVERGSLTALLALPVRTATNDLVRLRDVVRPVETRSVSRIYHRQGVRAATVTANFAEGSPHTSLSMAERIDRELLPRFAGRSGLEIYQGGEAVESRKTTADVGIVGIMVVIGILLVIAIMLGSFLEALFVIAIIPFAFAAVMVVFFLHQRPLTLFALMGTVGLAGVVVNSSIVMVDAIHRRVSSLREAHRDLRMDEMLDAVVTRLRPILVTTLTTLGGVLPMAYGIGGYDVVVAPMSLALGWGLGLSTLVTLVLVPVLYSVSADLRRQPWREWLRHPQRILARRVAAES